MLPVNIILLPATVFKLIVALAALYIAPPYVVAVFPSNNTAPFIFVIAPAALYIAPPEPDVFVVNVESAI